MNISVIQLIKLGQKYLSLWPEKPELTQYFEDYWAVQSARFVCRYFPGLALFTVIMQLYLSSGYFLGQGSINQALSGLPHALLYGLFLISMPVQALVYSGVKADKLLSPSLASWYHNGLEKIIEQAKQSSGSEKLNTIAELAKHNPRYIDLAQLLQITFTQNSRP